MELKFNISEEQKNRVINAFCKFLNYEGSKEENETEPQFVKRNIIEYIKNIVKTQEAEDAKNNAINEFEDFDIS